MKKAPYLTLIFPRSFPPGPHRYAGGLRCRITGSRSSTRIDMALTQGVPSFMQVLEVVTTEMQVEAAVIAEEIKTHNPQLHATLLTHLEQLQQHQGNTIEIRYTSHEQFKKQTADSQAVIRSGECSPFANIILCAGVTF